MAYEFNGSNQYLSSTHPVSAAPFTMSAWAKLNNSSGNRGIISIGNASTNHRYILYMSTSFLLFYVQDSSGYNQISYYGISENTWYHCCAVMESSSSRKLYINGINVSSSTLTMSPVGIDSLYIGAIHSSGVDGFMNGQIADAAVWNAALTEDEIKSLADGMTSDQIRPQNLAFHAPLIRNLNDTANGLTIVNNNSASVFNHMRIYA